MQTKWLSHLKTEEEREEFKKTLRNSRFALDKLREIVYNIRKDREVVKQQDYNNPSWAYLQAHNNGYLEALIEFEKLLDLGEKDK